MSLKRTKTNGGAIGGRLRIFAHEQYGTVSGLATAIGKNKSFLQSYVDSTSLPGASVLQSLALQGLNINWLLTGNGSMLLEEDKYVLLRAEVHKQVTMRPVGREYKTVDETTTVVLPVESLVITKQASSDGESEDPLADGEPHLMTWDNDAIAPYSVGFMTCDGIAVSLELVKPRDSSDDVLSVEAEIPADSRVQARIR